MRLLGEWTVLEPGQAADNPPSPAPRSAGLSICKSPLGRLPGSAVLMPPDPLALPMTLAGQTRAKNEPEGP